MCIIINATKIIISHTTFIIITTASIIIYVADKREKYIHGIVDSSCAGVSNLGSYPGMERNFEGSDKPAFCWYDQDLGPIRIADCPEPTSDASTVNTYVILCTVLMTGLFSLLI